MSRGTRTAYLVVAILLAIVGVVGVVIGNGWMLSAFVAALAFAGVVFFGNRPRAAKGDSSGEADESPR